MSTYVNDILKITYSIVSAIIYVEHVIPIPKAALHELDAEIQILNLLNFGLFDNYCSKYILKIPFKGDRYGNQFNILNFNITGKFLSLTSLHNLIRIIGHKCLYYNLLIN